MRSAARSGEARLRTVTSAPGSFLAKDRHDRRQPVEFEAGEEAEHEGRAGGPGGAAGGFGGGGDLQEDDARMVEEDAAGGGELDAARRAGHEAAAELGFEVAHLAAQRGLGGVEALGCGDVQAARLGDGDEIAEVTQVHGDASKVSRAADQVLAGRRLRA